MTSPSMLMFPVAVETFACPFAVRNRLTVTPLPPDSPTLPAPRAETL